MKKLSLLILVCITTLMLNNSSYAMDLVNGLYPNPLYNNPNYILVSAGGNLAKYLDISSTTTKSEPLIILINKLKDDTVVDLAQITTISKQRIVSPVLKSDPLYNIRIVDSDLMHIKRKIINHLYLN